MTNPLQIKVSNRFCCADYENTIYIKPLTNKNRLLSYLHELGHLFFLPRSVNQVVVLDANLLTPVQLRRKVMIREIEAWQYAISCVKDLNKTNKKYIEKKLQTYNKTLIWLIKKLYTDINHNIKPWSTAYIQKLVYKPLEIKNII